MKPVSRDELVDYQTYNDQRDATRARVLAIKELRRVVVADTFLFLFENRDTVRYQVQEMMRAERIVREADIAHELRTYNELLGGQGELGCTLLVTIDDPAARDEKLRRWLDLNERLYLELEDGTRVRPTFDPRQVGDDRLSSVQYLKFTTGPTAPVAVGVELEELVAGDAGDTGDTGGDRAILNSAQRAALQADLDCP